MQDVFVTSGASEAVDACITALVNPGENILTPRPDYPLYSAVLCKLGIELNTYDLNEDDGWQPDLKDLESKITPKTRANCADQSQQSYRAQCAHVSMLEQIAELARRHNLGYFFR